MAFDYTGIAGTAKTLLTNFGQTLTFTRETSSSFDPATGIDTTTSSSYTGYGAGFDYTRKEIDGEIIQSGDVRLVIESVTTTPLIGDSVVYNGSSYRIMNINELSPSGIVVIYKLQIRK